jgi:hypothetical protein
MVTVNTALRRLGACSRAVNKYTIYRRSFKKAFIDAHWQDAEWLASIFGSKYIYDFTTNTGHCPNMASSNKYPKLPSCKTAFFSSEYIVDVGNLGKLFRKKKNREKYWPEVRDRLIEIGLLN